MIVRRDSKLADRAAIRAAVRSPVEQLESRLCLSADPAGTWQILGDRATSKDDVIDVRISQTNPRYIQATINGKPAGARRIGRIRGLAIHGGQGSDRITVDLPADFNATVKGGSGDDTIVCGGERDFIWGGAGHDIIDAGGGADVIRGGDGADILCTGRDLAKDVVFRTKEDTYRGNRLDRSKKDSVRNPGPFFASETADEDEIMEATFRYQFPHNASAMQQNAKLYFLSIDGADPSDGFMQRFAGHDPAVKKVSSSTSGTDGVTDNQTGEKGIIFRVETIKRVNATTVEVKGGYYEAGLSASGNTYYLKNNGPGWVVTKATTNVIA